MLKPLAYLSIALGLLGAGCTPQKPIIDMVQVEGGSFMMSPRKEQPGFVIPDLSSDPSKPKIDRWIDKVEPDPGTSTTLSSFWIGKTEVTQAQWTTVMGTNPSQFMGNDRPVDCVSWFDAVEFCNKLSQREGLSPAYRIHKQEIPPGRTEEEPQLGWTVTLEPGAQGYRLPSEAQWEFAARGGNLSKYTPYSGGTVEESVGWVFTISNGHSHPVGTKTPNELGLHDMTGNLSEWCGDWYAKKLLGGKDPLGPDQGEFRIHRGGSWYAQTGVTEVAARKWVDPLNRRRDLGFRVVKP